MPSDPSCQISQFTALSFLVRGVPLHTLYAETTPLLITFSAQRFAKARDWLQTGLLASERPAAPGDHPFPIQLAGFLTGAASEARLQSSPFLRMGTALQQEVWKLLLAIPRGETRSYGDLARALGNQGYARAVGQACKANPLALLIPCHRVVAGAGLGGYAGGQDLKGFLLALERKREEGGRLA